METMKYITIPVSPLETNCYLVFDEGSKDCLIIDPGAEPEKITKAIAKESLKPLAVINTHGHFDHAGANKEIKEKYDIPLLLHSEDVLMLKMVKHAASLYCLDAEDSPPPDRLIQDGEDIEYNNLVFRVIHTPGHSPGGICLLQNNLLFSGDTLFHRGVGRTDIPGGSWNILLNSIRTKILTLPEETLVLPGHGPPTQVGQEKRLNPFIQ